MEENLLLHSEATPPEFELALWMDPTAGAPAVSACHVRSGPVSWVTPAGSTIPILAQNSEIITCRPDLWLSVKQRSKHKAPSTPTTPTWGCLPRNETAAPPDASSTNAHVHLHYPCEGVRGACRPSGEIWSELILKIPHQDLQGWGSSLQLVSMTRGVNAWIRNSVTL